MVADSSDSFTPDPLDLLDQLICRHLVPARTFVGAVLVGSRVHDEHRRNSDVDCVFIFEHVDERIIPGEFVWVPSDDSFHSIFDVEASEVGGVQVDAIGRRVSWMDFSTQEWAEGLRHDLARQRVLFERGYDVRGLIARRTAYDEETRLQRLSDATSWAAYYLTPWRLERWIERAGLVGAHDQLDAAFEELLSGLHAYNRVWLPWRYRLLASTLKLQWVPSGFAATAEALRTPCTGEALQTRRALLSDLQANFEERLERDGLEGEIRRRQASAFAGLGFAGSMEAWRQGHRRWLVEGS